MSITFWNSGEKYAESIFTKGNNPVFFHFGKLSAKRASVTKQICCKGISIEWNLKPILLYGKIGQINKDLLPKCRTS